MREELLDKVLKQGYGFTASELRELGVGWPPQKGWRKKLLKALKRGSAHPKKEHVWPKNQDGFLIRASGSGRAHHYINGEAVCRSVNNRTKYIFTPTKPTIQACKLCTEALRSDPTNTRPRNKSKSGFYQSWEWKKLRFETIKRYGPVCMCCGSDHYIVVDHIKPRTKYPDLALDPENLQILCNDCNMGKSNDDETDFRPTEELNAAELMELELLAESPLH